MKKITTIILAVLFTANLIAQVPNYVPTNGLVGWWPFNGNANDESGNGNNGTVNGATLTTDRFGNANKAYSFDGINDYINVLYSNSLHGSNGTINAWIKTSTQFTSQKVIFAQSNGRPQLVAATQGINGNQNSHSAGIHWKATNGQFPYAQSLTAIDNAQWIMITGLYALDTLKIYINGTLEQSYSTVLIQDNCSQSDIQIGGFNTIAGCGNGVGFSQMYIGIIDDIGMWNRALSQSEITALYTGCINATNITPQNNSVNIGNTAIFTANTAATSPNYIWQSDFGQGFQTLNNVGKYSGTSTKNMSISNVQLSNHMQPIRAISVSGNCRDTSNIAYVKITDTCITKINDTIKITKYDTIKVMDTLVINANLSGISAPNNTNRIIVYPNPAKDHITIDYGVFSKMSGYTIKITNTLGQTVFSSPINQQSSFINLSSWTGKGVYYLQIIDTQSNMIENRKIVLQ
jgi:hypothetical protein